MAVLILFFVSEAQTPSPLIRPAGSIYGGAEGGEVKSKGGGDWTSCGYYLDFTFGATRADFSDSIEST
ncbi:MAG: hypothetical protein ABL892_02200 [Thiobacillaceae bacterium]